ncbi:MAG: hypothetical protein ACLSDX_11750 [Parabacteroides merdae]
MYFIFPDNLPVSVQKAAFEFTSGQFPLYRYITPDTEILNRGISIAIPDEASHIRSIRLTTSLSHFTYYYPEKGYKIAQGIHLPPFPGSGSRRSLCKRRDHTGWSRFSRSAYRTRYSPL